MGELCLGTFLQILYRAINEDKTNTKVFFIGELLSLLTNDFDPSSTAMSKLYTGINNPTKELTKKVAQLNEDDYYQITNDFKKIIMPMLNPNRISDSIRLLEIAIAEDSSIKQDTVVDLVSGTKKCEMTGEVDNQAEFLAGVFLFVMINTSNPKKSGVIGLIVDRLNEISPGYVFTEDKKEKQNEKREYDIYEEQIEQKATEFCIKYDSMKKWIPLCQIAQITNPTKKHNRIIFNDYCVCTRSVQQKILEMNNIVKINESGNEWWYKYLDMFEKDYEKYSLGNKKYLYSFAQYFPRLLEYGGELIQGTTQRIFTPNVVNPTMNIMPNYKYDVWGFIDEYVYYGKYDEYKNKLEPPMDYMWRELDFGSCPEFMLSSFLAQFIIGTCRAIPFSEGEENELFAYSGVGVSDLETAEDLFYQTLLVLYENYEGYKFKGIDI